MTTDHVAQTINEVVARLRQCNSLEEVVNLLGNVQGMQYLPFGMGTHFYAGYAFKISLSHVHAQDARILPHVRQRELNAAPALVAYLQLRRVNVLVVRYEHCENGVLEHVTKSRRTITAASKTAFLNEMLLLANHPLEGQGRFLPDNPGIIHRDATEGLGPYLVNPRGDIVLDGWFSAGFADRDAFRSLRRNIEDTLRLI